jgi:hypothetical protein
VARPFIDELRTARAVDELAEHGLAQDDALEVWWDTPSFFRDTHPGRLKMIGRNTNGDLLTIVIEPTSQYGAWDVVTGFEPSSGDETAWKNEHRHVGKK